MKADIQQKLEQQLKKSIQQLPPFASDFIYQLRFRKKELRTQIEYAKDVGLFLRYMIEDNLTTAKTIRGVTPDDMKKLTYHEITYFISYLTKYTREYTNHRGTVIRKTLTNTDVGKSRKIATLHSFFAYLTHEKIVPTNIVEFIDIKATEDGYIRDRLTYDELNLLFETILNPDVSERQRAYHEKTRLRDYVLIKMLAYTGVRVSELVQLDIDEINLQNQSMVVLRKGNKKEKLQIPNSVIDDLAEYLDERRLMDTDESALFLSMQKKRIETRTVRQLLKKYQEIAGIKTNLTPHVFRRTFGTNHYNNQKDMYLTAQILGHSSADTTRKFYADPDEDRRNQSMQEFDYKATQKETPQNQESVTLTPEMLAQIKATTGLDLSALLQKASE